MAHKTQIAYSICFCLSGHPSKYGTGSSQLNMGDLVETGAVFVKVLFMGQIELF